MASVHGNSLLLKESAKIDEHYRNDFPVITQPRKSRRGSPFLVTLILGIISIIFGLTLIALGAAAHSRQKNSQLNDRWLFWVHAYGLPIIVGVWASTNGILGLLAGKKESHTLVLVNMSFSIISVLVCAMMVAICFFAALLYSHPGEEMLIKCYRKLHDDVDCLRSARADANVIYGATVAIACVCFLVFAMALTSSVYACIAVMCCVCCKEDAQAVTYYTEPQSINVAVSQNGTQVFQPSSAGYTNAVLQVPSKTDAPYESKGWQN